MILKKQLVSLLSSMFDSALWCHEEEEIPLKTRVRKVESDYYPRLFWFVMKPNTSWFVKLRNY